MGQTLPNGIYLPAEGERNCYDGLEGNWRSLDGLISTVAGKASASHSHGNITNDGKVGTTANKPLITGTGGAVQAGSFGNQANTFCEGNDSRLSDARTPVAHTHTKSDVTDLLNSNFIPSANNSYDLGSSSYQWNNVYAKGYYYNGVAWGLDKANTWSADNIYTYSIAIRQTNLEEGELPASNQSKRFRFIDKNDASLGWLLHRVGTSGDSYLECVVVNKFSNGQLSTQGSEIRNSITLGLSGDGSRYLKVLGDVYPDLPTRVCNLGTSTNKWKTLNGINPGALSLPNSPGGTGTVNVNYYDLSGNITVRDGSAANGFTAPCDGWIAIGTFATWLQISNDTLILATTANPGADGFAQAFLPVRKGNAIRIVVNQTNTQFQSFKLLPCEGNV